MMTSDTVKYIFKFLTNDDLVLMKLVSKTFKRLIEQLDVGSKCNLVTLYDYGNIKLLDYIHSHFKMTPDVISICQQPKEIGDWWSCHFEGVRFYVALRWKNFDSALKFRNLVGIPLIETSGTKQLTNNLSVQDKYQFGGDALILFQVGVMGGIESLRWIHNYSLPKLLDIYRMCREFVITLHSVPAETLAYMIGIFPYLFKTDFGPRADSNTPLREGTRELIYKCLEIRRNEHFKILAHLTFPKLPISDRELSDFGTVELENELRASGFDINKKFNFYDVKVSYYD